MIFNNEDDVGEGDKYELGHIVYTSEEDAPGPPPLDYTSPFLSVEEWLIHVCDKEHPKMAIEVYRFALYEGEDEYTLCLTGINTYQLSLGHTQTLIDFAPEEMYYTLPGSEYQHLQREQVLIILTAQLKAFTETNKFKHSFLGEAQLIKVDWQGVIWAK